VFYSSRTRILIDNLDIGGGNEKALHICNTALSVGGPGIPGPLYHRVGCEFVQF